MHQICKLLLELLAFFSVGSRCTETMKREKVLSIFTGDKRMQIFHVCSSFRCKGDFVKVFLERLDVHVETDSLFGLMFVE